MKGIEVASLLALSLLLLGGFLSLSFKEKKTLPSIVFYFAPGCGYCHAFFPEWKKFEALAPSLGVTPQLLRCTLANKESWDFVEGFPTVLLYPLAGAPIEFSGKRTKEALESFVQAKL